MSRVLSRPGLGAVPRMVAAVEPADDPVVRALVDRAAEAGRRQGYETGRAAGREAGREEARQEVASLVEGAAELAHAVRRLHAERADGVAELAVAIAAHVLDREPSDEGRSVVERIRRWLAEIDDDAIAVAVSPAEHGPVAAALGNTDVRVTADESLRPGEITLSGASALAELRHAPRWDAVRAALGLAEHEQTGEGAADVR